jgi:hypothetical protein
MMMILDDSFSLYTAAICHPIGIPASTTGSMQILYCGCSSSRTATIAATFAFEPAALVIYCVFHLLFAKIA